MLKKRHRQYSYSLPRSKNFLTRVDETEDPSFRAQRETIPRLDAELFKLALELPFSLKTNLSCFNLLPFRYILSRRSNFIRNSPASAETPRNTAGVSAFIITHSVDGTVSLLLFADRIQHRPSKPPRISPLFDEHLHRERLRTSSCACLHALIPWSAYTSCGIEESRLTSSCSAGNVSCWQACLIS